MATGFAGQGFKIERASDAEGACAAGVVTVVLAGTLDVTSQHAAEQFIAGLVSSGHRRLAFDCSELAFVSSAGLRALIGAVKLVKPHCGGVALCARLGHRFAN